MSLETNIVEYNSNYDFSKIVFQKPESCVGGYFSRATENTLQTPYLNVKEVSLDNKELFCSLNNDDDSRYFFQFLYDIEEFVLLNTENNSKKWFKKEIPSEILYKNQKKPWIIDRSGDIILRLGIAEEALEEFSKVNSGDNLSLTLTLEGVKFGSKIFSSVWNCNNYKSFDSNYNLFDNVEEEELFRMSDNEPEPKVVEESVPTVPVEESVSSVPEQKVVEESVLTLPEVKQVPDEEVVNDTNPEEVRKMDKKRKKKKRRRKKIIYANKVKYIDTLA